MAAKGPQVRVLIVHPRDPMAPTIGGIQTFLHDFIKYAPPDFAISIVGLTRDPALRPVGRWLPLDVVGRRVRFLPVGTTSGVPRSPRAMTSSAMALARALRALQDRRQILQVHRPYRAMLLNRHRGPKVQFIHLDLRDWPGPSGWPKLRRLYRQFSDATLEGMDRVFVVNEPGALRLRAEHPGIAERIEFLPVWYDEQVFRPVDEDERRALRTRLADRLGLDASAASSERFVLLAVRLTEIKKPLLAIETLAALLKLGQPTARLVVAGAGELLDDARQLAALLGVADRVHFLGDRPRGEIAELMQASDALLLTARSEGGGPRVVLEALACGLPVVSTPVVEVRRTVETRLNGWLVDEATPEALAEGVAWVLAQPRAALAEAAMAAAKPFTAQTILGGLYETYRRLVVDAQ
ncbi:MAG: glycosyltransferase family 4 protein [Candidatus Limnocylindrales bacterium]